MNLPKQYPKKLTRLSAAVVERINDLGQPVISVYDLFQELRVLFQSGRKLYTRGQFPNLETVNRVKRNLRLAGYIDSDPDYRSVIRVLSVPDLPADDLCCIVDPFCYISHLSAMQRFGFTNRNPKFLHLTIPNRDLVKMLREEIMEKDYGPVSNRDRNYTIDYKYISHPKIVRGRQLNLYRTLKLGESQKIRNSLSRISTVGQTFVDMLSEPELCGGMSHILDVWREYAALYLDEILEVLNGNCKAIVKVRGGYILEEILGIQDNRIQEFERYAQRGGSRLLDPSRPYKPVFSEKWMISINH